MQPFCLWANEIRYKYVYYRQKLGIYIYIYIRLSVYIKQGGGGCHYDDSTAPQVVVTATRYHDSRNFGYVKNMNKGKK